MIISKTFLVVFCVIISIFSFSRKPEGVIAVFDSGQILDATVDTAVAKYINQLKRLSGNPDYYPEDLQRQRYTTAYDLLLMEIFCKMGEEKNLIVGDSEIEERYKIVMSGIFDNDSAGFIQALEQDGWSIEEYRANLRKVILSEKARKDYMGDLKLLYKDVKSYYNKNKNDFKSTEREIAHILIADPDYDAPERGLTTIETELKRKKISADKLAHAVKEEKEKRKFFIDSLRSVITAGQDTFKKMARKFSNDPSAAQDGNLGVIKKGQMVESFDKTAFDLDSAEVSFPIRTEFGWHLVKAMSSFKTRILPIKEVEYRIRDILRSKAEKEKIEELLNIRGAKLFIYEPM